MKAQDKKDINSIVLAWWDKAFQEDWLTNGIKAKPVRLNKCNAWMYETENYIWLKSYKTVVAYYDKRNEEVIDALRLVYGYTATSCQHIWKFYYLMCKRNICQPSLVRYY